MTIKASTIYKLFNVRFLPSLMFIAIACLALQPINAKANPADERYTEAQVISERSAVKPGDEITVAINIKLKPHWHVYWDNPGDSGLPVRIDWTLPKGFEVSDIKWPVPDKISYDILVNYGYYNDVTLLQTVKVPDTLPEGKITLTAQVDMLVCNEICIPESSTLSLHLNDPDNLNAEQSEFITAAQTKLPKEIKGQFFFHEADALLHLSLTPENRTILNTATEDNTEFFPHDWGIINHVAMPQVSIENGSITIKHERGDQPVKDLKTISGLLVIKGDIGQNIGFWVTAKPENGDTTAKPIAVNKGNSAPLSPSDANNAPAPSNHPPPGSNINWFSALYLALLGGMILNLMPCVFPVLSMKALSLIKMKDKEHKRARLHGIAYTLGIMLSFLAFGGALIAFKEAGTTLGWGFQLQNPLIVATLAYLLFAIGLNLMGFFEFGGRLTNVGNKLTRGDSLSSSFFTGALATIVATPCTAPFMGAAMGFALTQPTAVSLSVFAMLGFGLALPYLFLSFVPAARHLLPKPGAWMNTFKQLLAFPMFASAIWLIWVLSQQTGAEGVLLALLGLLAIAFSAWLIHLENIGIARAIAHITLVISLLLMTLTLSSLRSIQSPPAKEAYAMGAPYQKETLSTLLKGDDPIFVEMTAAWCITCKLNHAVAVNIESTKKLFQDKNVQYLIGDWTNQDEEITAYLDTFGRNGVPLYVYYGKRDTVTQTRPKEIVLPQVLTPAIVKEYIGN